MMLLYVQAASAHAVLSHLGPSVSYPLYNQPQDTQVYHDNIRRHRSFRKRLADHLRKIRLETEKVGTVHIQHDHDYCILYKL